MFVDRRTEDFFIEPGRAYKNGAMLSVKPDIEADFTSLPFEDESFFHVVFDPPHHTDKRLGNTGTGILEKKKKKIWKTCRGMGRNDFAGIR